MRRLLFAALLLVGCRHGELLVGSDGELVVDSVDKPSKVTVHARKAASFTLPPDGNPYDVTLRTPGRATLVGRYQTSAGACDYDPKANLWCSSPRDRREHPFAWLRDEGDAPFEVPASGEGFVFTADRPGIVIHVSLVDAAGISSTTTKHPLVTDAKGMRGLPLVVPVAPGRYDIEATRDNLQPWYAPYAQHVEPGQYRHIHVQMGTRVVRESPGGSMLR